MRTAQVGKCFYSMQLYAHNYWLDHLLAYVSAVETSPAHLTEMCKNLYDLLAQMSTHSRPREDMLERTLAEELGPVATLEPRLVALSSYRPAFELTSRVVQQQQLEKLQFGEGQGSGKSVLCCDELIL